MIVNLDFIMLAHYREQSLLFLLVISNIIEIALCLSFFSFVRVLVKYHDAIIAYFFVEYR